jgi:hypothetical protein
MLHDFQNRWKYALLRTSDAPLPAEIPGFGEIGYAIHRSNVLSSLITVLEAAYPTVSKLVGTDFFADSAARFAADHPPDRARLLAYGKGFASHIGANPNASELPYLEDMAHHDWARTQAYHAADAQPLDSAALTAAIQGDAGPVLFEVHPSAQLIRSEFPVFDIWAVHQADEVSPVDIHGGGQSVLVIRTGYVVNSMALSGGGAAMIEAILARTSLLDAAQAGADADVAFDLQGELTRCLLTGLFTGWRIENN